MAGDYAIELHMRWSGWYAGSAFSKASSAVGPQVVVNWPNEGKVSLIQNGWSTQLISSNVVSMNTNTWRHFVFMRRGTQLEIWINGRLDNSITASVLAFTNTAPLEIGNGQYKINGTLDEVVFYNHSLTPLDVLQHYRQSLIPTQASIGRPDSKLLYAFDSASQDPASPMLLADALHDDGSIWLYDPTAEPSLQIVSDVQHVNLSHFNSLMSVDPLGVDLWQRQALEPDTYFYRRIPSGVRTGLVKTSGGNLNETWSYAYDVVSNITSITKPGGTESFGYDALDRLSAYTMPSQAQVTYGYDYDGNRLSETQSGVTVNHTYGTTSNRQLTAAGATIGYDANGNRASDTGGTRTFSYDVRNRLKQAVANSQTVGTYTINALGQRVRKVAGSADTDFVYNLNGQLVGEYTNGTLVREYVYLDNIPVAQIVPGGVVTNLHPDHLGTPRSATNSNAQIVWRWDSDPFGKATPNQDPDGDLTNVTVNLRFPGQYFDLETGLNYNYFRDYEPSSGRYVQNDPIGLDGGINTYGYVAANPLTFTDPEGLDYWVEDADPSESGLGFHQSICVGKHGTSNRYCISFGRKPGEGNCWFDCDGHTYVDKSPESDIVIPLYRATSAAVDRKIRKDLQAQLDNNRTWDVLGGENCRVFSQQLFSRLVETYGGDATPPAPSPPLLERR